MADRWAVANGNWSNTATWNGGTLPGSGDDVFADGRAVVIDQDITVLSIRTTQRSGGTAGGSFTISTNRTITCDVRAGSTDALVYGAANLTVTINGNVTGGSTSAADGLNIAQVATTTINGNLTGGTASNAHAVVCGTSGTLTVNGNVIGGSSTGRGLSVASSTTVNVIGNIQGTATAAALGVSAGTTTVTATTITGASTSAAIVIGGLSVVNITCSTDIVAYGTNGSIAHQQGVLTLSANLVGSAVANSRVLAATSGIVRVNGNITGGTANNSAPVSLSGNGFVSVFGNVTGGSVAGTGIVCNGASLLVVGNVTGGSSSSAHGVSAGSQSLGAHSVVCYGTVTGGSVVGSNGLQNLGGAPVYIFGSTVAGVGAATSNSGSGSITVVPTGGGGGSSLPLIGPGGLVY
jgi:hypothetical protein